VKEIQEIVKTATDPVSSLQLRHEAFGDLVSRFQDMAFGCAFAVLGDACLAEDAAQEAFVVAWQKLSQLREPAAFGGWLKRIVQSQCNRFTRAQRLKIDLLEAGAAAKSNEPGPDRSAEKQELLTKVLQAIKGLPENERLVTTLFYVNGFTQADIAEFLEAPVSTVNKRLYSARQRLKQSVVESFKVDLHKRRPSRNRQFSNQVKTRLRPFSEDDWKPIHTIASQTDRDHLTHKSWVRRRQQFDDSRYFRKQYVVEDGRTRHILAYGAVEQTIYLPKYRLLLLADPGWLKLGAGEVLIEQLTNDLNEAGAVTVSCRRNVSEIQLLTFLKKHGFAETSRLLDLRLDLGKYEPPPALSAMVSGLHRHGISICTLAEERTRNNRCAEMLYELTTLVQRDDPARSPLTPPSYNAREAEMWLNMAYVLPAGYFIAKRGDEYIGVSDVSLFDSMPGAVTSGFTGVKRECRGLGVATALKTQAILYAQSQGYQVVQAFNQRLQSAILALNQKLGFEVLFEYATLEKCLKKIIAVDPSLYDSYAGLYRDDRIPDLAIVVRNEAGRLTAECAGQKVELFPTSETSFFVKQFHGEANFDRQHGKQLLQFKSRGLNPESERTLCATRTN